MERIKTVEAWRELMANSTQQPFLIFKYSMTCSASLTAKKEMQKMITDLPVYLVVVQQDREVSAAIAQDLGVRHESPQVLIIKNGKGTWQATHYHIKKDAVKKAVGQYA